MIFGESRISADTTLASLAAEGLRKIRQMLPRGPYLLGGYSIGGAIAFEMAQQLAAAGETPPWLFLIDGTVNRKAVWELTKIRQFLGYIPNRLIRKWKNWEPDKTPEQARMVANIKHNSEIYRRAVIAYKPQPYHGRAGLWHTDACFVTGWRKVMKGELHVYPIAGGHHDVHTSDRLVPAWGAELQALLSPRRSHEKTLTSGDSLTF
jgi:thioesterase domain-containing protein